MCCVQNNVNHPLKVSLKYKVRLIIVLSILKLILIKKLQTFVTNNVFLDKKVKAQQQRNNTSNKNPCRAGNGTWEL